MTMYRYSHSFILALRSWPSPGPVGYTPRPTELLASCLQQEKKLALVIDTLNNVTIAAGNAEAAKLQMSKDTVASLGAAGYLIVNMVSSYLPVYDKAGKLIGHTTESYIFDVNGVPVTFSFSHAVNGQSYAYKAYVSVAQSVLEASETPNSDR